MIFLSNRIILSTHTYTNVYFSVIFLWRWHIFEERSRADLWMRAICWLRYWQRSSRQLDVKNIVVIKTNKDSWQGWGVGGVRCLRGGGRRLLRHAVGSKSLSTVLTLYTDIFSYNHRKFSLEGFHKMRFDACWVRKRFANKIAKFVISSYYEPEVRVLELEGARCHGSISLLFLCSSQSLKQLENFFTDPKGEWGGVIF